MLGCSFQVHGQAPPTQIVDIWFRYFIGDKHPSLPNYIKRTENGLTVIEAPPVLLPAPIVFDEINRLRGTCFTTDQRSFSPSEVASARVTVNLRLKFVGRELLVQDIPNKLKVVIGQTRNVDCKTGQDLVPPRKAEASDVKITDVRKLEFLRNFSFRVSASDPFYTVLGRSVAPTITSEILFQYEVAPQILKLTGTYGDFPWFEAYYRIDDGSIKKIIQAGPKDGSGAFSLLNMGLGINLRNFTHEIEIFN